MFIMSLLYYIITFLHCIKVSNIFSWMQTGHKNNKYKDV